MSAAATASLATPATVGKLRATLAARLALRGFSLLELPAGGWLVHRWNLTWECADLHAVAAFADRVEGAQAEPRATEEV